MSITWNGVSSDTIGVIVERIPNRYVPTRRFSPQQVAGRNGNILLVDKAFPNVEQEYEVYLSAESQGLPSVARACAEWLMGPDGYCRLTDSYDTTVYREAFLMGGFDIENILNKFGRCTITFSCKPQKYLLTGDTPIEIPDGTTTTYTGDVVQFDVITGASITSLSTAITPTQDLHGYSNPWPAGGGKNLADVRADNATSSQRISVSGDEGDLTFETTGYFGRAGYTVPVVTGQTYTISFKASKTVSSNANSTLYVNDTAGNWNYSYGAVHISKAVSSEQEYTKTITATSDTLFLGFYISAADSYPDTVIVKDLQVELGSSKTSYSPYSNICPITGRTGLSVYRTGKNLLDDSIKSFSVGGYVFFNTAGDRYHKTTTLQAGTYTFSVTYSQSFETIKAHLNVYNVGTDTRLAVAYNGTKVSFTLTEITDIALFVQNSGLTVSDILTAQLELSSTATTYESYNGNTYAVDWASEAGTVYGGTLDVVTGVLTVDRAMVDLGTLNWGYSASAAQFRASLTYAKDATSTEVPNMKCEIYKTVSYAGMANNDMCISRFFASVNGINVKDSRYTDAATFKTAMSGVQLCYELATPLTYQLTAQEIEALVGTNNVWSSSGAVSATVTTPLGGIVTNPTPFEARPLLEVSGVGEITINGKSIQILESVSDFEIDCETMEAEDNSKIYCMDFPELSGGENEIVGDGSITALTVTPRWWTL